MHLGCVAVGWGVACCERPAAHALTHNTHTHACAHPPLPAAGYADNAKSIVSDALFECDSREMVLVRGIDVNSMCEHHVLPFFGKATVAYLPTGRVVGAYCARTCVCASRVAGRVWVWVWVCLGLWVLPTLPPPHPLAACTSCAHASPPPHPPTHHQTPTFPHSPVSATPPLSTPPRPSPGLSKLARLVDLYAKRLQIQERLTRQVAEAVMEHVGAAGVAVMIECT